MGFRTARPDFVGKIDRPNPSGFFMIYFSCLLKLISQKKGSIFFI